MPDGIALAIKAVEVEASSGPEMIRADVEIAPGRTAAVILPVDVTAGEALGLIHAIPEIVRDLVVRRRPAPRIIVPR